MYKLVRLFSRGFVLALLGLSTPLPVNAAGVIAGRITAAVTALPVSQVHIDVGYGSMKKIDVANTSSDGAFTLSLQQLFPDYQPSLSEVTLFFRKQGYQPLTRVSNCMPRGEVDCSALEVQLGLLNTTLTLSDEDKQRLQAVQGSSGMTLYLLPYEIRGLPEGESVDLEVLAEAIHRRVNSRFQELHQQAQAAQSLPTVGLRLLTDIAVQRTDSERLDVIGNYVKALALVGGRGQLQHGDQDRILLTSLYHMVPSTFDFHAGALYVDDLLASDYLNSPLMFEALSDEWVLHTLIAVSVQKFKQARDDRDVNALKEIRAYLLAQRSEYGADEINKVALLDDLLSLVAHELKSLGQGG